MVCLISWVDKASFKPANPSKLCKSKEIIMSDTLKENAHAVLLPAFGTTRLSDAVKRFLSNGGCSILPGETREEYVAREMSPIAGSKKAPKPCWL